jgi:hypothetical protein
MKSILIAATLALSLGLTVPALAQQQPNDAGRVSPLAQAQDCTGAWKRADVSSKGILEGKDVEKFSSVMTTVDANKDGKLSQSEFMTACSKGELKNIQL